MKDFRIKRGQVLRKLQAREELSLEELEILKQLIDRDLERFDKRYDSGDGNRTVGSHAAIGSSGATSSNTTASRS